MKHLNSMLLIAAGVVLGATGMLVIAPYLLDTDVTIPYRHAFSGLKEGYGDVWGGLIGGIVAAGAAFGIYWATSRSERERQLELRSIHADGVLTEITRLQVATELLWESLDVVKTEEPWRGFLDRPGNLPVQSFLDACAEFAQKEQPDPLLGRLVLARFRTVRNDAKYAAAMVLKASNPAPGIESIIEHTARHHGRWAYESLQSLDRLLNALSDELRKARHHSTPFGPTEAASEHARSSVPGAAADK